MKAVAFSLDALFALLIASAGITVMLYFVYDTITPAAIQYSTSSNFVTQLASTRLSSLAAVNLASAIINQSKAAAQPWPQKIRDEFNSGGNPTGPSLDYIDFVATVPQQIVNGTIVAGYGNVYFGAGQDVYAVNATTGNVIWSEPSQGTVNSTVLYDGMFVYATGSSMVALNAINGTTVWSATTQAPASGEFTYFTMYHDGLIIGASKGPSATYNDIFAYYAINGTYAGGARTIGTYSPGSATIPYAAVANGQLASDAESPSSLPYAIFTTYITNATSGLSMLWEAFLSNNPTGISSYGNSFTVAKGSSGASLYKEPKQGATFVGISTDGYATGLSSYKGKYVVQGDSGMVSVNQTGTTEWGVSEPVAFGSAGSVVNATPIQSSSSIYSLWVGGSSPNINYYLAEENDSTGNFTSSIGIAYKGAMNPNMALAYGKLFASFGGNLTAFGTCGVDQNASLLSVLGTMYINNEGSCADYLLYSLQGLGNATMSINDKPIITTAFFGGSSNSIIVPAQPQLEVTGPYTMSVWFNAASLSNGPYDLVDTTDGGTGHNFDLEFSGGTNPGIATLIGNGLSYVSPKPKASISLNAREWYNVVVAVSDTGATIYVNGANISYTSYGPTTPEFLNPGGYIQLGSGTANTLYGAMSNLQIYDGLLEPTQISQIYTDGLYGPPVSLPLLSDWFPLAGNANGYGPKPSAGYSIGVTYNDTSYNATGLVNSFSVASQSTQVSLLNYSTGQYNLYNVSVYSWR